MTQIKINGKLYNKETGYVPSEKYIQFRKRMEIEAIERKAAKEIVKQIQKEYISTVSYYRNKIREIYGNFITFVSDSQIMKMAVKIKQIMKETNMRISDIIAEIRAFLGYNFNMKYYNNEGKLVPLKPSRIGKAYNEMKKTNSFIQVENILLF